MFMGESASTERNPSKTVSDWILGLLEAFRQEESDFVRKRLSPNRFHRSWFFLRPGHSMRKTPFRSAWVASKREKGLVLGDSTSC